MASTEPNAARGAQPDARSPFRLPVLVLVLLTLTAGFADGLALVRHDVFVANQSGNVVRIGMGAVGYYPAWPLALLSMAGFAVGSMLAWLLGRLARRRSWSVPRVRVLAVTTLLACWALGTIAVGDTEGGFAAFFGASAMGVMATVLTQIAGVRAQTTFQSGTVLLSAQGLMDWISRDDDGSGRRLAVFGALTLACYAAGGAMGALAAGGGPASLLACVAALLVVLVLARPRVASG